MDKTCKNYQLRGFTGNVPNLKITFPLLTLLTNKQTNKQTKKQAFYWRSVLSYQVVLPMFVLKESGGCGVIKNESVENIYLEHIQMSVPGEGRKNDFQQLYECL